MWLNFNVYLVVGWLLVRFRIVRIFLIGIGFFFIWFWKNELVFRKL